MRRFRAVRFLSCAAAGALMLLPSLRAATCSGNSDVNGAYGFVAERRLFWTTSTTPPGTTGTTAQIDNLVGNAAGTSPFGATGVLQADGNGNLLASSTPGAAAAPVGTYTENTDCTITVTLNSTVTAEDGTTTTSSATFDGVVSQTGNAIDLVESSGGTGTVLTLGRIAQQFGSCTNASISGTYIVALAGETINLAGSTVSGAAAGTFDNSTLSPFGVVGQATADGNGNFASGTLTGTYTVNSDCTGTATLTSTVPNPSTGVPDAARNVSFVLTSTPTQCAGHVIGFAQSQIDFVFTDQGIVGAGTGRPQ